MADDPRRFNDGIAETTRQLEALSGLSDRFGGSLTRAFSRGIVQGRQLDGILKSVGQSLVQSGLRMALAPLQG